MISNKKLGMSSCVYSHFISKKIGLSPNILGININIIGIKIHKCQLKNLKYKNKKIQPNIIKKLKTHILFNKDNKHLDCLTVWKISDKVKLKKSFITLICNALNTKITKCQLKLF